jgi:hypothetical protein
MHSAPHPNSPRRAGTEQREQGDARGRSQRLATARLEICAAHSEGANAANLASIRSTASLDASPKSAIMRSEIAVPMLCISGDAASPAISGNSDSTIFQAAELARNSASEL